jgi:CRISPR/Cas system endoribonuclease Cas6 (RAMP superfamily)
VDRARTVETVASHLRWIDWERYSNRQQTRMRLGGFVGQVTYRGDFTEFFPYLLLGTYTHVGKGATFGLGGYRVAFGQEEQRTPK